MNLTLTLEHTSNPDIPTGYWGVKPAGPKRTTVSVKSIPEGRQALRDWITKNELGGGNLSRNCGILKRGDTPIGKFSFNGRFWDINNPQKELPDTLPSAQSPDAQNEFEPTSL